MRLMHLIGISLLLYATQSLAFGQDNQKSLLPGSPAWRAGEKSHIPWVRVRLPFKRKLIGIRITGKIRFKKEFKTMTEMTQVKYASIIIKPFSIRQKTKP